MGVCEVKKVEGIMNDKVQIFPDHYDVDGVIITNVEGTSYEDGIHHFLLLDSFGNHLGYTNEEVEEWGGEGTYIIDRDIKPGDIVIDAGAFIGDFSAYVSYKGGITYAFEPSSETYRHLEKTAVLNNGTIIPIKKGLSHTETKFKVYSHPEAPGCNSLSLKRVLSVYFNSGLIKYRTITFFSDIFHLRVFRTIVSAETVEITTVDEFVKQKGLKKVSLIKADIEGHERDLLRGAVNTMKTMAPELSICTYHLPDDPEVLEAIIREANPNYVIIQKKKKLHAFVP